MTNKIVHIRKKASLLSLTVALPVALIFSPVGTALADRFDEEMNELRQQNAQVDRADNQLETEERSLAATLSRLQNEIAAIETQITENQAKRDKAVADIAKAEVELVQQKETLGESIKVMYVESQITTLEMLATSNNLSDYVDKEEYRTAVQSKIKTTVDRINGLKVELEKQKTSVEKLLADQQAMQGQLASQKAEQSRLMGLNKQQQSEYESKISSNNNLIDDLKKQQAADNLRLSGGKTIRSIPDSTGYPWANVAFPNESADPWGMYKRQCVSYTAWKVWKSGRHMPYWGGRGNANQWDDNARKAGIPVDGNPKVGDVAVSNRGTYGHVMYVEKVAGDGSIYISDYNQQLDGDYREYWISAEVVNEKDLVFVHF